MGAVAWAIWQRSVSHPRSSNRTCPIKASGSPTSFTVRHTAGPLEAGARDAADRVLHRQRHRRTGVCHALPLCAVWRGSRARAHRRIGQRRGIAHQPRRLKCGLRDFLAIGHLNPDQIFARIRMKRMKTQVDARSRYHLPHAPCHRIDPSEKILGSPVIVGRVRACRYLPASAKNLRSGFSCHRNNTKCRQAVAA